MSKGLAMIKAESMQEAKFVYAQLSSNPLVFEGLPTWVEYGVEQHPDDWNCKACSSLNFHWRHTCFKCQVSKTHGI